MKRVIIFAGALAAVCTAPALADSATRGTGNNGNGNGNETLTLVNGSTFSNPGKMFQYLRTRTDAAAGNPKAVVNAYPDEFSTVGDLIQQKRDATVP
jgi:hypothetical protein